MSERIAAIPTIYNGRQYRSRLEAQYAQLFDQRRMRFSYEEESFDFDGVKYLPDFWLPDIRTIVEVKGLLDDLSLEKVARLASAVGVAGGDAFDSSEAPLVILAYSPVLTCEAVTAAWGRIEAHAATCDRCRRTYFATTGGTWRCRYVGCDGSHS